LSGPELEEVVSHSLTDRGRHRPAGDRSDVLRAVGQALDQLHAVDVCLELSQTRLNVRFADEHSAFHELTYVGDELEALRRAAAARRNGQPVRRILILEAASDAAAHLLDLLVAEFAVQSLPTRYAHAVALSSEPPDLVLAQASGETVDALPTLRAGCATDVPLVVLANPESDLDVT